MRTTQKEPSLHCLPLPWCSSGQVGHSVCHHLIEKGALTMRVLMSRPAGPASSSTSRMWRDTSRSFVSDRAIHALSALSKHEPQFTCPSEYFRQQATVPSAVFPCPSSPSSTVEGVRVWVASASSVSNVDMPEKCERVKIVVSI